jgi:hypothetical protein
VTVTLQALEPLLKIRSIAEHTQWPYERAMTDLDKELREILGPVLEMPPMTDAEAVRFIAELKAMRKPDEPRSELIEALEEAWHRAAASDMARR